MVRDIKKHGNNPVILSINKIFLFRKMTLSNFLLLSTCRLEFHFAQLLQLLDGETYKYDPKHPGHGGGNSKAEKSERLPEDVQADNRYSMRKSILMLSKNCNTDIFHLSSLAIFISPVIM